ncbi:MAG: hypothetical protein GWN71_34835, partial [Gammaproteobacteria bacterium]|nr:hypothetical protein [Gammaproteobacteria bacterium]NIY11794.1 hypothetical protein [Gemmatimonadota bacterium]
SLALAAVLAAAPLTGLHADGAPVLALMALGHLAALLLIPRALDPASGRRGGRNVIVALGLLVGLTAAYALTFYRAAVLPAMPGPVPLLGAAGLIVAGALLLLPRPGELRPLAGPAFAAAVTAVTAGIAAALALLPGGEGGAAAPTADSLRVATYNVHYGYDEGWRFDPGRIAETIDRVDVDVIALQEVPIGLPSAYGIDLPLWLGERTRMRPRFSATAHDLLGEAVLARVALRHTEAVPLPDHGFGGEPAQVLRASLPLGSNTVAVLALHLSVRADVRWRQLRDALEAAPRGAAIVLGDLNARETDPVPRLLRKAGFHDAFRDAGRPAPTFPAGAPDRRIDWIWVRGLTATAARVDDATASDHRLVVATVRVEADGR